MAPPGELFATVGSTIAWRDFKYQVISYSWPPRLDTLARAGQYQTGQITTRRFAPIRMPQVMRQALYIGPKTQRPEKPPPRCPYYTSIPKRSMRGAHF